MYYMHPGCQTSIFGENRAYCIQDFTVTVKIWLENLHDCSTWCYNRQGYCNISCILWCYLLTLFSDINSHVTLL